MKTIVITDSSADVNAAEAAALDLPVIRFPLIADGKSFIDDVEISFSEFKERMLAKEKVGTSQASIGVYQDTFEALLKDYDQVIYVCISKGLSGAYQSACRVAEAFDNRVLVLDTRGVIYGQIYLVEQVRKMVEAGMSLSQIKDLVENNETMTVTVVPEDIQYLKRGGRITPTAAALANLLKICPVLIFKEGVIEALDKVRTFKKAIQVAEDYFDDCVFTDYQWWVSHGDSPELAEEVAKAMEAKVGLPVPVKLLYPVIMAHTGPGTIAIGRMKKLI
ncbi:MAG: DegV family protein [Erysipelotrichaceae bacterium]|jgi:DegV family protein with EDD domain|nr:DegV family protein [Erysipelotrichaceae bacterium]